MKQSIRIKEPLAWWLKDNIGLKETLNDLIKRYNDDLLLGKTIRYIVEELNERY